MPPKRVAGEALLGRVLLPIDVRPKEERLAIRYQ
jgi:hypothetical protein